MSVQISIPQIAALREEVEAKAGISMRTHTHFIKLVSLIEKTSKEHISESTLERIWSYSTRQHEAVSLRSLDVLALYTGHVNWDNFCIDLKSRASTESEIFNKGILSSESLQIGTKLRIGWYPDRICVIRYLGNYRFVAEETTNSTMKPGDSFSCIQLQKGHELYLDDFVRAGEDDSSASVRYAVGQEHGLTVLDVL